MFETTWSKNKNLILNELGLGTRECLEDKIDVSHIGFLYWEEHCIECAPPLCYSSCKLYERRDDGKCARFVDGIEKIHDLNGGDGNAFRVAFRPWGKLETRWTKNPVMYELYLLQRITGLMNKLELLTNRFSKLMSFVFPTLPLSGFLRYLYYKSFNLFNYAEETCTYDGFLVKFYCPNENNGSLIFEIMEIGVVKFRSRLECNYGWNEYFFRREDFPEFQSKKLKAVIWNEGMVLIEVYFSWLHLVRFSNAWSSNNNFQDLLNADHLNQHSTNSQKVKCVVFDLDNTLWNGVIGDDGFDNVFVRKDIVTFIKELDKLGILCSISSKNTYDLAWSKIKELELEEFFLFPQINWNPKSIAVLQISKDLNIGLDSIVLIDDNNFERNEVMAKFPMVRTFGEQNVLDLLELDIFRPVLSESSKNRRLSYLAESRRRNVMQDQRFSTPADFLRSCEIKLNIIKANRHFERCYELMSRSNQFNISGSRYDEETFRNIVTQDAICWGVEDKFGDYGIVGMMKWYHNSAYILVTDFVMSCRVAEKYIEEALLKEFFINIVRNKELRIKYVKTGRNIPIYNKLISIGFYLVEASEYNYLSISIELMNKLNTGIIESNWNYDHE